MGFLRQGCWGGLPFPSPVDHLLSGSNYQGHALQPLNVAGWHAGCPSCLTTGPPWAFEPSLSTGCRSTCTQGSRQRPCWSGWEEGLGKAGADVGGHSGWKSTPASSLPLAALEPICCPGVSEPISHSGAIGTLTPLLPRSPWELGVLVTTLLPPPTLSWSLQSHFPGHQRLFRPPWRYLVVILVIGLVPNIFPDHSEPEKHLG